MPTTRRVVVVLVSLTTCGSLVSCTDQGPRPGPLKLSADDRLLVERQAQGRTWRVYNDCAMGRNTTWISDDGGKSWLHHDGPGFINCTVASAVRLQVRSEDEADAEVDHGPDPVHERWKTRDGGVTWRMTATDLSG